MDSYAVSGKMLYVVVDNEEIKSDKMRGGLEVSGFGKYSVCVFCKNFE